MKQILFIVVALAFSFHVNAQRAIDIKKADEFYRLYAYSEAIDEYSKLHKRNPENEYIVQQLAFSYQKVGDYKNALTYYEKHVSGKLARNEDHYQYAQLLLVDGQFEKAKEAFRSYQQKNPSDKRAQSQIDRINNFSKLNLLKLVDTIFCEPFNTRFTDMSAAFFNQSIAYISARDSSGATYSWNDQPFLDIYQLNKLENGQVDIKKMNGVNTKFHEGPLAFTNNFQTIWFTRNNQKFVGSQMEQTSNLRIYSSDWNGKKWKKAKEFQYNSDLYSVGHPAFSPDGNTLYFASNMEGSLGETDLFRVKKVQKENKKGEMEWGWSEPENMGAQFNTTGKEMFPFVDSRGVIFFASDGLIGFGGLDVFAAFPVADSFNVMNLGQPINSTYDDFSFIVSDNFSNGYLTSSRPGGVGSDDVYSFVIGKQKLFLNVKSLKSNQPLANVNVKYKVDGVTDVVGVTDQNGVVAMDVEYDKSYYFDFLHPEYIAIVDSLQAFEIFKLNNHEKTIYLDNASQLQVLVVNENTGDPLSGVEIKLMMPDGKTQNLITDNSGKIKYILTSTGKIDIAASKEKFAPSETSVDINELGKGNFSTTIKLNLMQLQVLVLNDETNEPIANAEVTFTLPDGSLQKMATGDNGKVNYNFKGIGKVNVLASKEKYLTSETAINITDQKGNFNTTVRLSPIYEGKTFVLENLYYDVAKWNIRPDAALVLDKLLKILVENPKIKIELSSHTDSRASTEYNQTLSQKRAQSAVDYLVSKGIDRSRMIAVGFGESKLLNKCADGVQCTDSEHQINRRTEVKVLEF